MIGKLNKLKNAKGEYLYPITVSDAVFVGPNKNLKEKLSELEGMGAKSGSASYLIELTRWGIRNDGSDAVNTSKGLNHALEWASQQGYTEVVLPKGIYLIDENNPIRPFSYMTLNLGGSTLRIRDNALDSYAVVMFDRDQQFSRLTNGKIEGDRYSHQYTSSSTHEFGVGIYLKQKVRYITLDNLDISNTTGDAIIAITSYGGIGGAMPSVCGNLEPGGINPSTGALTMDSNRIRSKVNLPMNVPGIVKTGYFGLYGDSYGGIGKEITTDLYDVIFYRSNDTFLASSTSVHFFDEVEVPAGASYAKIVIHQGTVPSTQGCTLTIRTPEFPQYIFIEKCNLHHCRRLGIAVCGAKQVYIRDCSIHHHSGTPPMGAIDIEDGYDLNQYIYIDGNDIYDNSGYNIIAVAGRHITITNNRISDGIFTINSGVNKAIVSDNYFYHTGPRLSGDVNFANNHLYGCRMLITGTAKQILIDNCYYHNSPLNMDKTKPYSLLVNNCKFINDQDFVTGLNNMGSTLIFNGEPQTLSNCHFEGYGIEALSSVFGDGGWMFNNVSFLNIVHPEDRITNLPAGKYTSCKFINSGRLALTPGKVRSWHEFKDCYFHWDAHTLFYLVPNSVVHRLIVQDSTFECPGNSAAFFFNGKWEHIEMMGNKFLYPHSTANSPIIEFWNTLSADTIILDSNTFISKSMMISVKADTIPSTIQLLFKNNFVKSGSLRLQNQHVHVHNYINGSQE